MSTLDRREVALAGHVGDAVTARAGLANPDPAVRATALGALARLGKLTAADLEVAAGDPSPVVRRRVALLIGSPGTARRDPALGEVLATLLGDHTALVAETACWAAGEHWGLDEHDEPVPPGEPTRDAAVAALVAAAHHDDPLVREAAVAALGATGAPEGREAVLAAMGERPAIRRRAVLALAAFDGPEVDAALEVALDDRDLQVRQAAEDLLGRRPAPEA